jgi:hypothetical protein
MSLLRLTENGSVTLLLALEQLSGMLSKYFSDFLTGVDD